MLALAARQIPLIPSNFSIIELPVESSFSTAQTKREYYIIMIHIISNRYKIRNDVAWYNTKSNCETKIWQVVIINNNHCGINKHVTIPTFVSDSRTEACSSEKMIPTRIYMNAFQLPPKKILATSADAAPDAGAKSLSDAEMKSAADKKRLAASDVLKKVCRQGMNCNNHCHESNF